MAQIIEQASLSMTNSLFGTKTFSARSIKVADLNLQSVTETWTENKEYEIKPSAGYDGISEANITVAVE